MIELCGLVSLGLDYGENFLWSVCTADAGASLPY